MNKTVPRILILMLGLIAGRALAAGASPYVEENLRVVKALSAADIAGLMAGKGMGYGKAAELNGYPGPAHVLELKEELSLSNDQLHKTEVIFAEMQALAKRLGAELIAAERALDEAFRNKTIDETKLAALVTRIGEIESRLREAHLRAHLQQAALLDNTQIEKYIALRGYSRPHHGGQREVRHNH